MLEIPPFEPVDHVFVTARATAVAHLLPALLDRMRRELHQQEALAEVFAARPAVGQARTRLDVVLPYPLARLRELQRVHAIFDDGGRSGPRSTRRPTAFTCIRAFARRRRARAARLGRRAPELHRVPLALPQGRRAALRAARGALVSASADARRPASTGRLPRAVTDRTRRNKKSDVPGERGTPSQAPPGRRPSSPSPLGPRIRENGPSVPGNLPRGEHIVRRQFRLPV